MTRAEIEAKRGIIRDKEGRILRSAEWREEKLKILRTKLNDCFIREKNIKSEIFLHEQFLGLPTTVWSEKEIIYLYPSLLEYIKHKIGEMF